MKNIESMLEAWCKSASIMHYAHHYAATQNDKQNFWFSGILVAALTAIVGSTAFTDLSNSPHRAANAFVPALALLAAVFTAINTGLDFRGRSQRHHAAATAFQAVRREIEEELVMHREGRNKDSYKHLRDAWTGALASAPRLSEKMHDKGQKRAESDDESPRSPDK